MTSHARARYSRFRGAARGLENVSSENGSEFARSSQRDGLHRLGLTLLEEVDVEDGEWLQPDSDLRWTDVTVEGRAHRSSASTTGRRDRTLGVYPLERLGIELDIQPE